MSTVLNAVQANTNFSTSQTVSLGFTTTAGSTLVAIVRCNQTPTCTGGMSGATIDATSTGQSGIAVYVFSKKNASSTSTWTATVGSAASSNIVFLEIQGDHDYVAGSLVRSIVNPGTSVSSTLTATAAGQVAIGFSDTSNVRTSPSATGGCTLLDAGNWELGAYLAATSGAGSQAVGITWTGNVTAAMVAVLYQSSAGTGGLVGARRSTLGIG